MNNISIVSELVKTKQWDVLKSHGVDCRHYEELGIVLLDYNQIEAKDNHPISDLCRGVIYDYDGNIVRKAFTRFYNYTQAGHDNLDVQNSVILEKLDGSLCMIYFCPQTDRWELGTRGTAFAEGNNEVYGTFRNFFLNCVGRTEEEFQKDCSYLNPRVTHIFEGCGPDNLIVTEYDENHLVELCAIDIDTMDEILPMGSDFYEIDLGWNVRQPKQYSFKTTEECIESLAELPNRAEGYVLYNLETGKRIKLKDPRYVLLHKIRGNGLTVNSICELVAANEHEEYIASFPKDEWRFDAAVDELDFIIGELDMNYEQYKHIEGQKEFALAVKDLPLSCCMFKARKAGTHVIHEFNQFTTSRKAEWIKERLL